MRRITLLLALMAAAVFMASGLALAEVIKGTNGNNTLKGTSRADKIYGLGGNDTLSGDAGADLVNGAGGADTYVFKNKWGRDALADASGADTVNFSAVTTPLKISLAKKPQTQPEAISGTNKVNWPSVVEKVKGGRGDDDIYDNAAGNLLQGGPGTDYVITELGNDMLQGNAGDDILADSSEASNETYAGFTGAYGFDVVLDFGGTADTVDLRTFDSGAVQFYAVDWLEEIFGEPADGNIDTLERLS